MPDNLFLSALRTESLPFRAKEFLDHKIVEIAQQTLEKTIREEAKSKDMPERYTNNIQTEFDGESLWVWVDFKGDDNEDLDLFFEEGTKSHWIAPIRKKALRWKARIGRFARAIYYKSGIASTVNLFSKGHYVSGIHARYVFADGFEKGYPEFKQKLKVELETYLEETRIFG